MMSANSRKKGRSISVSTVMEPMKPRTASKDWMLVA